MDESEYFLFHPKYFFLARGDKSQLPVAENVMLAQFKKEAIQSTVHGLESLAAALSGSEIALYAQKLLPHALQQGERLGLKRVSIADACQVSEATVSRWISGQVRPHKIIARAAIEAIRDLAARNARNYEQEALALSRVADQR